jgi:hypothetical protein
MPRCTLSRVPSLGKTIVIEPLLTPENLVEKDFDVVGGEVLGRDDDLVKITLHKFGNDISGINRK